MNNQAKCPVCESATDVQNIDGFHAFYSCPICGRYEISVQSYEIVNDNRLASYLYYNRFLLNDELECRYHTTLSKEKCDRYRREYDEGINHRGRPVHMDTDIIGNWYPKSFSQRTDLILIKLSERAKHIGQSVELDSAELKSLLFVDRKEISLFSERTDWRKEADCSAEVDYMLDYLESEQYINRTAPSKTISSKAIVTLTPKGYARVDAIQKTSSNGHSAFVAMKFGDDTKILREAIRVGIQNAEFNAVFIDEAQHNNFITPEILKHIRDSKFVVVDLTHQNNGAYFEEGYAMGIGKPVIQLCKKDVQLHFDIAQKNTIMWETEEDIPTQLTNRIKATID